MQYSVRLDDPGMAAAVGRIVRDARVLAGYSQDQLAQRAGVTQARVSRLERGRSADPDLGVVTRILAALGFHGSVEISDRHLDDRRQQRDPVHAWILGHVARRLARAGWRVETEVPIGPGPPRGWIDVLAIRNDDGLIGEIKGDIPDIGGLQRQVGFYRSTAAVAFAGLGWRPRRIGTLVVALDSATVHGQIAANRHVLAVAFPGVPGAMSRWIRDGGAPPPATLVLTDPRSRRDEWLLRTPLSGRRSAPATGDYAEAARWLLSR
ncbi:MAG: helix-turn-helix domain-containing protein [Candidatus Limnocylindrales bacterium]